MLLKITFTSNETETERRGIIDTILRFYAVGGVIERNYDNDYINWTLNMRRSAMPALRQDIRTLHICGFDLARTEL